MPEKKTTRRAANAKSPSTKAGAYVREEMEHVRGGKHGARSSKQAIAIGLSKARRAGVRIPSPAGKRTETGTSRKPDPKRSRATTNALKREGSSPASHKALSRQARSSAARRSSASRSQSARKAARTRAREA
jgi:hypothetical protein